MIDAFMAFSLLAVWTWLRLPRRDYRDYLNSPGWWLTKAIRKESECAKCGGKKYLQLHHESYAWHNRWKKLRYFIPNLWDEMATLCDFHHGKSHGKG